LHFLKIKTHVMTKEQLAWTMTMFGTAVGAGILFLPVTAGLAGLAILLLVTLVSLPAVYFAHRNIGIMLTEAKSESDYSGAVNEFFGMKAGLWINLLFFVTLFMLLIVYSSGLNDDLGAFMRDTGVTDRDISHSPFLSLLILAILILVIRIGEKIMLRFMSFFTFLLVIMLLAVSIYLIPQWNLSGITHIHGFHAQADHFLLLFPIFILSFSYYPALSSMIIAFKKEGLDTRQVLDRSNSVVMLSMLLLFVFIMFFVISCVFSLNPEALERAVSENLSVLTVLAEESQGSPLAYAGPLISQLALITSFTGTFLGARESIREILKDLREISLKSPAGIFRVMAFDDLLLAIFLLVIWVITILHLPILDVLGEVVAPPIAFFLCIMPVLIIYRIPRLKKYRGVAAIFTLAAGCLMLFSYLAGKVI
jgi:serine transporter